MYMHTVCGLKNGLSHKEFNSNKIIQYLCLPCCQLTRQLVKKQKQVKIIIYVGHKPTSWPPRV